MQDSKLILLLKTFDKEDWRWFRKFLLSPYFNNREELIRLFDYLRKKVPNSNGITKEKVFNKIYPDKSYNEKELSYAFSYLLTQAEKFLLQRQIEGNQPQMNNYLLNALVNRQLDKNYSFHYNKIENQLELFKAQNADYFLLKYQLADIASTHYTLQNSRTNDQHLQEIYYHLNQFYFFNLLKNSCELLTRKKAYGSEFDFTFIDQIVAFLNQQKNTPPIISIYLQIYSLLKEEHSKSSFEQLKELLTQFQNQIPPFERRLIYLRAINHCMLQINQNKEAKYFTEQSLELYLDGINNDILIHKGYLTPWTFKNVVKLGLIALKFDFTEDFIQTYHKKLEPEFQDDALHYNLADLHYRKKEYSKAQIHLIQVQYSDIFYTLGAKAMLLKIYYETNEIEALFALIASFSIYLRRNKKISTNFKASFSNFNSLLSQIIRAKKDKIPIIIEKIKTTKQLINRSWLLEICKQQ